MHYPCHAEVDCNRLGKHGGDVANVFGVGLKPPDGVFFKSSAERALSPVRSLIRPARICGETPRAVVTTTTVSRLRSDDRFFFKGGRPDRVMSSTPITWTGCEVPLGNCISTDPSAASRISASNRRSLKSSVPRLVTESHEISISKGWCAYALLLGTMSFYMDNM